MSKIMNIDKIIANKEPIFYKNMGPVLEYHIIRKITLIPDQDISDLTVEMKEHIERHTGTYVLLQRVDVEKDVEFLSIETFAKCWYTPHLQLKKANDAINSGKPLIKKFFEKYGVFNHKFETHETHLTNRQFGSTIIYDGYPTPDGLWNSTIKQAYVGFYMTKRHNNYIKRYGDVWRAEFSLSLSENRYVDTESASSIRRCHHDEKLQNDQKYAKAYTKEQWESDIDHAIDIYIENLGKVIVSDQLLCDNSYSIFSQWQSVNYLIVIKDNEFFTCQ